MINAAVISNGIEGIAHMFQSNARVTYTLIPVTADFDPEFDSYDLLVVPNGTDNMAMFRIRDKVLDFLNKGKILFCFDGWFTAWVPGNKWSMDNIHKTIDIRYHIINDRYQLFEKIDLQQFIFSHGISGWWACGHIEAAPQADVILADTWNRPIMVLDEVTTNGAMFLTASGPMADMLFGTNDEGQDAWYEIGKFYQHLIHWAENYISKKHRVAI